MTTGIPMNKLLPKPITTKLQCAAHATYSYICTSTKVAA